MHRNRLDIIQHVLWTKDCKDYGTGYHGNTLILKTEWSLYIRGRGGAKLGMGRFYILDFNCGF